METVRLSFLKMNVLNVKISCFANYETPGNPRPVNLITWLKSEKYRQQVEEIRRTGDKAKRDRLKSTLPAITPSGLFTYRKADSLVKHSGLIQFDIDLGDNQHITNFSHLKEELAKVANIAYVGLSVSGRGYWGLIPLSQPEKHREHFQALKEDFAALGITLDDKPGNVASLRGYSFDADAHFNPTPKPYTRIKERQPENYRRRAGRAATGNNAEKVEAVIKQIEVGRIDITPTYDEWFSVAAALANEFGEGGRDLFHRISRFYPGYKGRETDKQFTACLRRRYKYTIGTLFEIARHYGIEYRALLQRPATRSATAGEAFPAGWTRTPGGLLLDSDGLPAIWKLSPANEQERKVINQELQRISLTQTVSKNEKPIKGIQSAEN